MAARSGCEKNTPNFLPMKGKEEEAPIGDDLGNVAGAIF
jgi:hypothetical protein